MPTTPDTAPPEPTRTWRTSPVVVTPCSAVSSVVHEGAPWVAYQRDGSNDSLYLAHLDDDDWEVSSLDASPLAGVGVGIGLDGLGGLRLGYGAFGELTVLEGDPASLSRRGLGLGTRGGVSVTAAGLLHTDDAGDLVLDDRGARTLVAEASDGVGVVAADGTLHVAALSRDDRTLTLARGPAGAVPEPLDVGVEAVAIAAGDRTVHLAWYRIVDRALVHAEVDPSGLVFERVVATDFGAAPARLDLAVDPDGDPHIAAVVADRLWHVERDGPWRFVPLADLSDAWPAIEVVDDVPYVLSCDDRGVVAFANTFDR